MTGSGTVRWLAVVVWMAGIWTLSSIPSLQSGLEPVWDTILRKCAHAGEFAVLGWLVLWALGRRSVYHALGALLWAVGYAIVDEYHQAFVLGRATSLLDVLVDSWGALMGIGLRIRMRRA